MVTQMVTMVMQMVTMVTSSVREHQQNHNIHFLYKDFLNKE